MDTRWDDIPSMVNDPQVILEYAALDRHANEVVSRLGGGVCIEVGSFHGKSTALLAQYFVVLAIDTWGLGIEQGNTGRMAGYKDFGGSALRSFLDNMTDRQLIHWQYEEKSCDRVHALCTTSRLLEHIPPIGAKFAFVDAEHTYPAAYYDMVRVARHLVVGGVFAIHDIGRPGWGWGDKSRSDVDPWHGNWRSHEQFLDEYSNFAVKEHVEGIMFIERNE